MCCLKNPAKKKIDILLARRHISHYDSRDHKPQFRIHPPTRCRDSGPAPDSGFEQIRFSILSEGHRASQETVPKHGTLRAAAQKSNTHIMIRFSILSEGHRASHETVQEHGTLRAAAQKSNTHTHETLLLLLDWIDCRRCDRNKKTSNNYRKPVRHMIGWALYST